jgi:hypothetical protein
MTDRRQVEHRSIQNKELMCQNTTAIEKRWIRNEIRKLSYKWHKTNHPCIHMFAE